MFGSKQPGNLPDAKVMLQKAIKHELLDLNDRHIAIKKLELKLLINIKRTLNLEEHRYEFDRYIGF